MNKKKYDSRKIKALALWVAFGIVVTFTSMMLVFWIYNDITYPKWMSIIIGALIGLAFKLFSDRIGKDQEKRK
jgi:hypothetical protein